ncbi:hypothetical protein QVD17_17483 [Tagetes erecta]|uniref:Mitochondrial import inner membrane translocase subunit TIM22 n=1 Tax=Tagetes erecta TaxID=13708 RepID=A0AAD8P1G6_TARER|nr:hypothetical protein QVD17_17483 [Tagetes erecta]
MILFLMGSIRRSQPRWGASKPFLFYGLQIETIMDNKLKKFSLGFNEHQIAEFVSNYKKLEKNVTNLLTKPPLAVEAPIIAIDKGVTGAFFSLVLDTIAERICSVLQVPLQLKVNVSQRSHAVTARNFGVLVGVDAGITHVMKKLKGKEDIQSRFVSGFGAGVAFSVVRGDPPKFLFACGVICALFEAGLFKAKEKYKSSRQLA